MTRGSRSAVSGFSSGATALVVASVAWACTAVPSCAGNPDSGPAGTLITISCNGFEAQAPVEIRWNSPDGSVVGTATGSAFSVAISPPADAVADVYYLVALQRGSDGAITAKASDTFELTTSAALQKTVPSVLGDNWAGFSSIDRLGDAGHLLETENRSGAYALGLALLAVGTGAIAVTGVFELARKRRSSSLTTSDGRRQR